MSVTDGKRFLQAAAQYEQLREAWKHRFPYSPFPDDPEEALHLLKAGEVSAVQLPGGPGYDPDKHDRQKKLRRSGWQGCQDEYATLCDDFVRSGLSNAIPILPTLPTSFTRAAELEWMETANRILEGMCQTLWEASRPIRTTTPSSAMDYKAGVKTIAGPIQERAHNQGGT